MGEQVESKLGREISLKILWQIFLKRFWILVIAGALAIACSLTIILATYSPLYEAKSVLVTGVMGTKAESGDSGDDQKEMDATTLSLALHIIEACQYVANSDKILEKVMEQLPYITSKSGLKSSIRVEAPIEDNGIFLEIFVKSDTPEHAQEIANAICDESVKEIRSPDSMNYQAINKFYSAPLPKAPCNKRGLMTYLLIGVIAAALVYIFFLLLYIFDDRIKSDEEIRESFGLSVLGDVPNANELAKKGGYYRRYGKYGSKYKRYTQYGMSEMTNNDAPVPEKKPEKKAEAASSRPVRESVFKLHDRSHEKANKPDGGGKDSAPKPRDRHQEKENRPDGDKKDFFFRLRDRHQEKANKPDGDERDSSFKPHDRHHEKADKPEGGERDSSFKPRDRHHEKADKRDSGERDSSFKPRDRHHEKENKPEVDERDSAFKPRDRHHEKENKSEGDERDSAFKPRDRHDEREQKPDNAERRSLSKVRGKRREKMPRPNKDDDRYSFNPHKKYDGDADKPDSYDGAESAFEAHEEFGRNIQKSEDIYNRFDDEPLNDAKPYEEPLHKIDKDDVTADVESDGDKI